jgi:Domain of unknown function (DUF4349)
MEIGFLDELREDLLDAAWRAERGTRRRGSLPRFEWSTRKIIAIASAACLIAAGTTGWFVSRRSDVRDMLLHIAGPRSMAGSPDEAVGDQSASLGIVAPTDQSAQRNGFVPGSGPLGTTGVDLSKVIKTAGLSVVVPRDTFEQRFATASRVAGDVGGYVSSSSTHDRSGSLTMRIPADRFDDALSKLRAIGHVESQSIRGQDVTAQFIDLQARLRIARARRTVLLKLMGKANSIEQTIRVQNALDDTQQSIEDLQGSLNVLNDKVSYATITLDLREQGVQVQGTHVTNPSIPTAWHRAIAGFIGVVVAVIVGLGYVIPVAILLALAWLVVTRVRRRRLA